MYFVRFFARSLRARKYELSLLEFRRVHIRFVFISYFGSACTSGAKVHNESLPEFRRVRHEYDDAWWEEDRGWGDELGPCAR